MTPAHPGPGTAAARILSLLSEHESTVDELTGLLCIPRSTVNATVWALRERRLIEATGKRPQYGPRGRMPIVYGLVRVAA